VQAALLGGRVLAVGGITDQRCATAVKAIICARISPPCGLLLQQLLDKLPTVQQLGAADWQEVLACTFHADYWMPAGCLELPGVQQLDAEQLGELLHVCIEGQLHGQVPVLLQLPAAKLMPADALQGLLQQTLQREAASVRGFVYGQLAAAWGVILALPHAADVPVQVVQQLHDTAFKLGLPSLGKALLAALPEQGTVVCSVSGELLAQGMLAAIQRLSINMLDDRASKDLTVWCHVAGPSCKQLCQTCCGIAACDGTGWGLLG
jgi:hypothetical protein